MATRRARLAPGGTVTLCYGARTADYLAGVDDFEQLGVDVRHQHRRRLGRPSRPGDRSARASAGRTPGVARIVCCGPEPMMEAVADVAAERGVPCQVSLETPMACGIGICFSCVAKVRDADGTWDYKRTCVEGPIFDAAQIEW